MAVLYVRVVAVVSQLSRREPFAILPESVLYADIPDRAKVLYGVYARFADRDGYCYPSQEVLAGRLGCSITKVIRATRDLVDAKFISVQHRRGPNRVRLLAGVALVPPSGPNGLAKLPEVRLAETTDVPVKNAIPSVRPRSYKNDRSELEEPENQSRDGRAARKRARPATDDTTGAQLRDEDSSKAEDPLATRLAATIGISYAAALQKIAEWRCLGISPLVIDEATGYTAKRGIRTLAYVEKIAVDWMGQRNPGWQPPRRLPTFRDSQAAQTADDVDPHVTGAPVTGELYHLGERDYRDADGFWTGDGCTYRPDAQPFLGSGPRRSRIGIRTDSAAAAERPTGTEVPARRSRRAW